MKHAFLSLVHRRTHAADPGRILRTTSPNIADPEVEKLGAAINRLAIEVFQLTTDIERELTRMGALTPAMSADSPDDDRRASITPSLPTANGSAGIPDEALELFPSDSRPSDRPPDAAATPPQMFNRDDRPGSPTTARTAVLVATGVIGGAALLVSGLMWPGQISSRDLGTLDPTANWLEPVRLHAGAGSLWLDSSAPRVADRLVASEAVSGLRVSSLAVGAGVVERELVGQSDTFATGTSVVFWTHMIGGRPGDTIRHVWFHEGREVSSIVLPIGSPNWRTHSRHTLRPESEGEWVVELRDSEGGVLASTPFRGGSR